MIKNLRIQLLCIYVSSWQYFPFIKISQQPNDDGIFMFATEYMYMGRKISAKMVVWEIYFSSANRVI